MKIVIQTKCNLVILTKKLFGSQKKKDILKIVTTITDLPPARRLSNNATIASDSSCPNFVMGNKFGGLCFLISKTTFFKLISNKDLDPNNKNGFHNNKFRQQQSQIITTTTTGRNKRGCSNKIADLQKPTTVINFQQ